MEESCDDVFEVIFLQECACGLEQWIDCYETDLYVAVQGLFSGVV